MYWETGLLVPPERPEAWEDSIVELASSPALRRTLIDNARRQIRDHSVLRDTIHAWPLILSPEHESRRAIKNELAAARPASENAGTPHHAVALDNLFRG